MAVSRGAWVSLALALVAVVGGCGQAARQAGSTAPADDVTPVYREPMHRLVFESPLVRVLDVRIPPADTTGYHLHANPMVGVAVQGARIWSQAPGAPPGAIAAPEASPYIFDNWSQTLPYTHRVANADTVPLHYIVAEWLARSGPEGPGLPDGPTRRLVREGPTARVYEIALGPGAATEPHEHSTPGLVVLGNAGTLLEEGGSGAKGRTGAGSWSWREGAGRHVLRNDGATRLVVYEIDWR